MYEPGVTSGGPAGARLAASGLHVAAAVFAAACDLLTARSASAGRAAGGDGAAGRGAGAAAQPAATAASTRAASASAAPRDTAYPFMRLSSLFTGTPRGGGPGPRRRRRP